MIWQYPNPFHIIIYSFFSLFVRFFSLWYNFFIWPPRLFDGFIFHVRIWSSVCFVFLSISSAIPFSISWSSIYTCDTGNLMQSEDTVNLWMFMSTKMSLSWTPLLIADWCSQALSELHISQSSVRGVEVVRNSTSSTDENWLTWWCELGTKVIGPQDRMWGKASWSGQSRAEAAVHWSNFFFFMEASALPFNRLNQDSQIMENKFPHLKPTNYGFNHLYKIPSQEHRCPSVFMEVPVMGHLPTPNTTKSMNVQVFYIK